MSASVVVAFDTETRISRWPRQVVPPTQQVPSRCTASIDRVGASRVAEADEHLVEHDVVVRSSTPPASEPVGHPAGQGAATVDEVGHAVRPELAQRGPHREAPCPPRRLGRQVTQDGVGAGAGPGEVGGGVRHRCGMQRRGRAQNARPQS